MKMAGVHHITYSPKKIKKAAIPAKKYLNKLVHIKVKAAGNKASKVNILI